MSNDKGLLSGSITILIGAVIAIMTSVLIAFETL